MPLAFSILFLFSIFLFLTLLLNINNIEDNKPMSKVIKSQPFSILDFKVIYKTLELQIDLNKHMINIHEKLGDKQKVTEIKTVNKATKDTMNKVKKVLKEVGEKV